MKNVKLNNGVEMPILGFGTYQITDFSECERSVLDALETGYRSLDTAAAYYNETAVGNAIKKSTIPRSELFITTKLWIQDGGYEQTLRAFEISLKNLQIEYLDLYLIHQPYNDVYGSWRAMEKLYHEGRIRAIGVSNFDPDRLVDFIDHNEITPAVNQIETHPFFQQHESAKWLKKYGVAHESWGPFAEGKNNLFKNPILTTVAKQYEKTVAQVVLRWLIQRDIISIPKSTHPARIRENFQVFDFALSDDDMASISTLDLPTSFFLDHRDPEVVQWFGNMKIHD